MSSSTPRVRRPHRCHRNCIHVALAKCWRVCESSARRLRTHTAPRADTELSVVSSVCRRVQPRAAPRRHLICIRARPSPEVAASRPLLTTACICFVLLHKYSLTLHNTTIILASDTTGLYYCVGLICLSHCSYLGIVHTLYTTIVVLTSNNFVRVTCGVE